MYEIDKKNFQGREEDFILNKKVRIDIIQIVTEIVYNYGRI